MKRLLALVVLLVPLSAMPKDAPDFDPAATTVDGAPSAEPALPPEPAPADATVP